MAVGQAVFTGTVDVGGLHALELRLELREVTRSAEHGALLRDVLALQRLFACSGDELATVAHVGLLLRCSELRAAELLSCAQVLVRLPGAVEALECGLLTVEQSRTVVSALGPLPEQVALQVWERLRVRLIADEDAGVVLPPGRLRPLLSRWVIQADADAAVRRRRQGQQDAEVDYRRRPDGLVDLFATGLSGPDAQACLARIRACSAPVGLGDERPAGRRRLDALIDLILGREHRRLPGEPVDETTSDAPDAPDAAPASSGAPDRAWCGCIPGSPVPCGAQLSVLVPLGAALGTTDELAELVGHGPLEPDLLHDLLLAAPRLRAVGVDEHGVAVTTGRRTVTPQRGDPQAVREALLRLAQDPPGRWEPRHPDDHPPPGTGADRAADEHAQGADDTADAEGAEDADRAKTTVLRRAAACRDRPPPQVLPRPHPAEERGPYRVPDRLRRLLQVRRPLCEWPGCGARAALCDLDHDLPWPYGPTCGCNLGPTCRRHHRIKQLFWTIQRTRGAAVRWTSPTGRSWTSPVPHEPPTPARRSLPDLPPPQDPLDQLSPQQLVDELHRHTPDDPGSLELRAQDTDPEPEASDPLRQRLLHHDTRWSLDLDNPYGCVEPVPLLDPAA